MIDFVFLNVSQGNHMLKSAERFSPDFSMRDTVGNDSNPPRIFTRKTLGKAFGKVSPQLYSLQV